MSEEQSRRSSAGPAPARLGRGDLAASVVEVLAGRAAGACFVAELRTALAGEYAREEALEDALNALVVDGAVFLQHNYCPDPHFSGDDLRVVALIDRAQAHRGGEEAAVAAAQRLWQRWLRTFLASHRCT